MLNPHLRSLLCAAAALLLLGACADNRSVPTTGQSGPGQLGSYKVGNPYQIGGVWYYPKADLSYDQTGIASWYGPGFDGRQTANGESYDQWALTAAHPTLPMPSMVQVTNLENGRSIQLRINDRGPFSNSRIIDVSRRGAQLLGFENKGTAKVRVQILKEESLQLAALAQGTAVSAAPPEPAPRVEVESESLPDSPAPEVAPAVTPQTAQRPAAAAAPAPQPSGVVVQQPVSASTLFIQAGAFTEAGNASVLAQRLNPYGAAQIEEAWVDGRLFYRVRLPVADVEEADTKLAALISNGYTEARIVVD
ncbi:MAG: septal ring lytic transglycosylase RlpA family protein [Rhodovibrionaceae bacterium]